MVAVLKLFPMPGFPCILMWMFLEFEGLVSAGGGGREGSRVGPAFVPPNPSRNAPPGTRASGNLVRSRAKEPDGLATLRWFPEKTRVSARTWDKIVI